MTERGQRIALWCAAVSLVGGTALALRYARGYRPLAGLPDNASPIGSDIGLRFQGIRIVGRHEGKRAWIVEAGEIETTRSQSRVTFRQTVVGTLLQNGKTAATLSSPSAVFDSSTQTLTMNAPIRCQLQKLTIETQQLWWKAGTSEVHCPGPVRAVHLQGTVWGQDLVVDMRTREFSARDIQARFPVNTIDDLPL